MENQGMCTAFRLPRAVEADPRCGALLRLLEERRRPLWHGGTLAVPFLPWTPGLVEALRRARGAGQIVRSLECAETVLDAEAKGLTLADRRIGVPRGGRISRLLLLADDGADRFYRNVETMLRRHGPRVLTLRLAVDAVTLGEGLFGPAQTARLVLLERKEAVAALLLALVGERPPEGAAAGSGP